jgi:exodeoxyribonuclease VII large subunit
MSQSSLFDLMPERHIWRVGELTEQIGALLEGAFGDLWVEGEVSNYHAAQSGHLYFTLKDRQAQIRCVCFRDQVRGLKFRPEDGLHITVRGGIGVYSPRGEYQVYVSYIEPVGLGRLQLAFEQLKRKLQEEGLFRPERKKPLPILPRSIGVITSPTGAAIRDILRVLKRRFANVRVQLYPVKVQGEGAASEIAAALAHFGRSKVADVLILARGGGSLEDLWAFNEETVARAISRSEIPVITGVGHETDFTIADFVADLRAPTPSAAAEIVVRSRQEFERQIEAHFRDLVKEMRYRLSVSRRRLHEVRLDRGFRQVEVLVRRRHQQLDELATTLAVALGRQLALARQRLTRSTAQVLSFDLRGRAAASSRRIEQQRQLLHAALERLMTRKQRQWASAYLGFAQLDLRARVARLRRSAEGCSSRLRARIDHLLVAKRRRLEAAALQLGERSPFQLLERGYAIAYDRSGRVLRSADQIALGDSMRVRLARGELDATVDGKRKG